MQTVVIKLGAAGDVLRTLPVIKSIKEQHPHSKLVLITKKDITELLEDVSFIDVILTVPLTKLPEAELLYNFDIDTEALNLSSAINSAKKLGFYGKEGYPVAYNIGAEYYLNTIFDDELKRQNKKTYQEMMFESAEIPYKKEGYKLQVNSNERERAINFIRKNKIDSARLIGIHMGASSRWPSKVWALQNIKDFIKKASSRGHPIILFGGPNEIYSHEEISKELKSEGVHIYHNNPQNTKKEFIALLNQCKVVVCSDSFALHVAIGLQKPTIALFFCTSPREVEGYGLLTKIISPQLYKFFPERSDVFDKDLVSSISVEQVLEAVEKALSSRYK